MGCSHKLIIEKESTKMDYYNTWGVSKSHGHKGKQKMHQEKTSILSSTTKKGQNKKLSSIPQSVAARERRHRISNRFKILQSLIPGGTKMHTASMLDEAIKYVKFLKTQIYFHQVLIDYHYVCNPMHNYSHCGPLAEVVPDHNNNNGNNVIDQKGVHEEHAIMSQVSFENCCFQGEERIM